MNYKERYSEYLQCIETYLKENCFIYDSEPQTTLFASMRYSLLAGGKRLRPIFVFDFCRMCGSDWKNAVPFAAAVEMIHTYSLIHDDLPCMDNDDFRRGKPTNHKVYGEAVAVLAGDALLTAAFSFLAKSDYPADVRIRAVEVLAACAGELGMVGGQILDMDSERRQCTADEVIAIQSRKTGALIRAACCLGVLAGMGSEVQFNAASEFAANLGLAFQIRDDMLDVIGNAEEFGKPIGSDREEGKCTFVDLLGIDGCQKAVRHCTDQAKAAVGPFDSDGFLTMMADQLAERKM